MPFRAFGSKSRHNPNGRVTVTIHDFKTTEDLEKGCEITEDGDEQLIFDYTYIPKVDNSYTGYMGNGDQEEAEHASDTLHSLCFINLGNPPSIGTQLEHILTQIFEKGREYERRVIAEKLKAKGINIDDID